MFCLAFACLIDVFDELQELQRVDQSVKAAVTDIMSTVSRRVSKSELTEARGEVRGCCSCVCVCVCVCVWLFVHMALIVRCICLMCSLSAAYGSCHLRRQSS
jgi:hypothetical protein